MVARRGDGGARTPAEGLEPRLAWFGGSRFVLSFDIAFSFAYVIISVASTVLICAKGMQRPRIKFPGLPRGRWRRPRAFPVTAPPACDRITQVLGGLFALEA